MKGVEHRTGPCASRSVVFLLSDHGLRKAAHLSASSFLMHTMEVIIVLLTTSFCLEDGVREHKGCA